MWLDEPRKLSAKKVPRWNIMKNIGFFEKLRVQSV
jgi:hypothetical protein